MAAIAGTDPRPRAPRAEAAAGRAAPAHVLFFVPVLGGGGAEKHLVRIANHLDRARFRVSIAVLRGGGAYEAELRDDVEVHVVGAARLPSAVLPLRRLVARLKPDLLCPVMDVPSLVALLAVVGMRGAPPVVPCVQVPPSVHLGRGGGRKALALPAVRLLYPRAARIVALSEGVKGDVATVAPRAARLLTTVYNAGVDATVERDGREPLPADVPAGEGPLLVAAGRLNEQKGFTYLLRAFAKVRERVPARLWILGEGELRASLTADAEALGVRDHVWFAGFQTNPYRFMRAADVFVLSSLYEGFGNVVAEAMAVGTPVVSTDCPHGPGEIIADGESGLLVPPADAAALAAAIVRVLEDNDLRERLGRAGAARALDFSAAASAEGYGSVFAAVLRERREGR